MASGPALVPAAASSGPERVLFTGSFYRAGTRGWLIAPLLLAILALVCLVVNLAVGPEQLPRGLDAATPWFGVALALAVLLTGLVHVRTVMRLRVGLAGEVLRLELRDRSGVATIAGFRGVAGWHWGELATGRRTIRHPILELAIRDEHGACPVLLREELGVAHGPPAGWREGRLAVTPGVVLYAALGRVHLDRLAAELERLGRRA